MRFEARVAAAAVRRAEQKLALAQEIGSLEDVQKAEAATKMAWAAEEREFKEAQEAEQIAMAAAKAVLRSQEEESKGERLFEEGLCTSVHSGMASCKCTAHCRSNRFLSRCTRSQRWRGRCCRCCWGTS